MATVQIKKDIDKAINGIKEVSDYLQKVSEHLQEVSGDLDLLRQINNISSKISREKNKKKDLGCIDIGT